jgi:hypothetical protein
MENIRISLYGPDDIWRAFRIACLEHNISASKAIFALMEEQLARWKKQLGRGAGSDYPPPLDPVLTNELPEMLAALERYLKGS